MHWSIHYQELDVNPYYRMFEKPDTGDKMNMCQCGAYWRPEMENHETHWTLSVQSADYWEYYALECGWVIIEQGTSARGMNIRELM